MEKHDKGTVAQISAMFGTFYYADYQTMFWNGAF